MSYFSSSFIKYYYSNASAPSGVQSNPYNSLGGYISSSEIPFDSIDSIFPSVSGAEVVSGSETYRAVFVKNTSIFNFYNAKAYFGTSISGFYFGVEEPVNNAIQLVTNGNTSPTGIVWYNVCSPSSGISIGDIYGGNFIGIWFKRVIGPATISGSYDNSMVFCIEGYAL